jgi:DNA-binding CsgD family transcriptional regulator
MSQHDLIVENRRSQVLEYHSTNKTQREIASLLNVSVTTVNKDLAWLREKAEDNIKDHMSSLSHQYAKTCAALDVITKRAFSEAETCKYVKDKHALLTLAMTCVKERWMLASDASVIEEAMSFVEVTNGQVKHEDTDTDTYDEQPTNQQLPNDSINVPCHGKIGQTEPAALKNIAEEPEPEDSIAQAEAEFDKEIEDIQAPVSKPVKRFAKAEDKNEPLDIHSSMSDIQRQQQDEQDQHTYKPLHDSMLRNNTYNPAKRRYLA